MNAGFSADPHALEAGSSRLAQHAEQYQAVPRQLATLGLGESWGADGLIAPFALAVAQCVQAGVRALSVHGAVLDDTGRGLGDTAATLRDADATARGAVPGHGAAT
ncbi:hypothetical protein ACFPOI_41445 [Nonomuraea angiospora]|uniref:Uncharacterized protein n=1 Tax=Nonomuraea angiospora TaxID=46172 RepID=A0ABR9M3P7_9ACTN|nr:hypothetical protein [Nonomuraea angiospora]MBE1587539.1 hypothetical protein [Nonomuraea angiospora]